MLISVYILQTLTSVHSINPVRTKNEQVRKARSALRLRMLGTISLTAVIHASTVANLKKKKTNVDKMTISHSQKMAIVNTK